MGIKMKYWVLVVSLLFSLNIYATEQALEAGDSVRVSVFGSAELTTETIVSLDGMIDFPLIGLVSVKGKTPKESEELIALKLSEDGFLRKAQVNVIVLSSINNQVSIIGNVLKPGKYQIEPGVENLLDLLAVSGGITKGGSKNITVIRIAGGNPKRIEVDLEYLLLKADATQVNQDALNLVAGDLIYIPEEPVFYTLGEVGRVSSYPYKSNLILAQALSISGGVSPTGSENKITIKRKMENDLYKEVKATMDTVIYENDIIIVDESLF